MKNKEFYKDKIYDAACKYRNLAVDKETGELRDCHNNLCEDCLLLDIKCEHGGSCSDAWRHWLEQEHVEPLLTSKEKRYLENVVRPFKNRVKSIQKNYTAKKYTCIHVDTYLYDDSGYMDSFSLPYFDGAKMYTGMEVRKCYTLEELGLFTDEEEDDEE